ncbi:hypothetical protein BD309DRAFT_954653 [Dichomitus squalens]|nr:hypothetical protein BD309DRAFT_954653 [Dichomitus squalens]
MPLCIVASTAASIVPHCVQTMQNVYQLAGEHSRTSCPAFLGSSVQTLTGTAISGAMPVRRSTIASGHVWGANPDVKLRAENSRSARGSVQRGGTSVLSRVCFVGRTGGVLPRLAAVVSSLAETGQEEQSDTRPPYHADYDNTASHSTATQYHYIGESGIKIARQM